MTDHTEEQYYAFVEPFTSSMSPATVIVDSKTAVEQRQEQHNLDPQTPEECQALLEDFIVVNYASPCEDPGYLLRPWIWTPMKEFPSPEDLGDRVFVVARTPNKVQVDWALVHYRDTGILRRFRLRSTLYDVSTRKPLRFKPDWARLLPTPPKPE